MEGSVVISPPTPEGSSFVCDICRLCLWDMPDETEVNSGASACEEKQEVLSVDLNSQMSGVDTEGIALNLEAGRVTIKDLPDEMMIKIFSYMSPSELIDVVRNVCSRWRSLSQDVELWHDKVYEVRYWDVGDTDTCVGHQTDADAVNTLRKIPNLRALHMHRGARSEVFHALYTHCHRLEELKLCCSQKLSYSVMKNIVEKCSKIKSFKIADNQFKSQKSVEALSQLQHLRSLELENESISAVPLRILGDGCPQLCEIDFTYAYCDMEGLKYFLNAKKNDLKSVRIRWTMRGRRCVTPLLKVCVNTLERLELHEWDVGRDESEEAFVALGCLKNLQVLTMRFCDPFPLHRAALAFKDGGLPKLRVLNIKEGICLEDDTVIAISRGCPALCELRLPLAERISDAGLSQIHRLKHLEVLDVSGCTALRGAAISYIARLPMLHTLVMEYIDISKLEPGLSCILKLSNLRCLKFCESTVRAVPFDCFPSKLINLRELYLCSCQGEPSVTEKLSAQMPNLEIYGCITDETVEEDEDNDDEDENADEGNEEGENNVNQAQNADNVAGAANDDDDDDDDDGGVADGDGVLDDNIIEDSDNGNNNRCYNRTDSSSDSEDFSLEALFYVR